MRRLKKLLLSLLIICLLSSCAVPKNTISYTVYPIGYLLKRLVNDKLLIQQIQNEELVQQATLVDGYEKIVEESAALFHIGQLEPYIKPNLELFNNKGLELLDLSTMNAIYKFQRYTKVETAGATTFLESAFYEGDEFDSIDMHERDLSLWVDPIAMLSMGKTINKWLQTTYPEYADVFQENCDVLELDLVQLDAEYQKFATTLVQDNEEVKFVSMTSSFTNWQKTFGFQVYPVILSKYGTLPTDEQLAIIKQRIINDNVRYIVYEPNLTAEMLDLYNELKDELNLSAIQLNNLSSLTEQNIKENKDYISIMYENLNNLKSIATPINDTTPIVENAVDGER